jgi:hypothetical protein
MTDDVSETAASIHIRGDDLDPDEVTRLLGCEPKSGWRKGEFYTMRSGSRIRAWTGRWMRDVADRAPGDLDGQIAELLKPLTDDLMVWMALSERFDVYLYFGIFIRKYNQAMGLSPATLRMVADRGIRMDFELYADVPPEEPESEEEAEALTSS